MNIKIKEKGNIAFLVLIILVLVGASGFLFYRYRSSDALIADLSKRFFGTSLSSKTATPSSATAPKASTLLSTPSGGTVYYQGKVLNVVEDKQRSLYTVTLQPQDNKGNNTGKVTTFTIPKYPPKTNVSTLGTNFKQMIDKGLNPINIKINYDKNNRFLSWESVSLDRIK